MKPLIPILAAFIEPTEMAENTPFLKADGLAAFRAFFAQKTMLGFMTVNGISGKVSVFQHPRNGIRDRQHQSAILKNRMLSANPF